MIRNILLIFIIFLSASAVSQEVKIALLKYNGGGDWYANPTALPNLIDFCNKNLSTEINKEVIPVEVGSLDIYFGRELKKVFPVIDLGELPFDQPIFHQEYSFPNGLPKIHQHDDKDPQGFGLIYEGRLVCFYDFECDLGDGWESPEVHNDSPEKREEALQMGANIIQYVFTR